MTTIIQRPDVAVIVLTRNAGRLWPEWIKAIQHQTVQAGRYLVIDSLSEDHTAELGDGGGLGSRSASIRVISAMVVRANWRRNCARMPNCWCI